MMKLPRTKTCSKCKREIPIQYGSVTVDKAGKLVAIHIGYYCEHCKSGISHSKFKLKLRKKIYWTYASIRCGHHSGYKKCCIAWHALFYQHAISAGSSFRAKFANWYFGQIGGSYGYIPCPLCMTKGPETIKSKPCPAGACKVKDDGLEFHYLKDPKSE